jgi:hypothetical protein
MTPTQDEMLGAAPPKKITIDESRWGSTQRLLARMMVSWEHSLREARLLLSRCRHDVGCPAVADARIPCLMGCPDRETWLSAKVVEQNALEYVGQLGPFSRNHPYSPPTREYWDRIMGELEAQNGAGDMLGALRVSGVLDKLAGRPVEQPTHRLIREPELELDSEDEPDDDDEEPEGIAS